MNPGNTPTVWKQPHHQDGEAGGGPVKQLAGEGLRRRREGAPAAPSPAPGAAGLPAGSRPVLLLKKHGATLLKNQLTAPAVNRDRDFDTVHGPASSCALARLRRQLRARCQGGAGGRTGKAQRRRGNNRAPVWRACEGAGTFPAKSSADFVRGCPGSAILRQVIA